MDNYHALAKKYLQFQKKRTILTILGVTLSAGLLFVILTLYFSFFFNSRDAVRAEADYEMVFFPENQEEVSAIVNRDYVKTAYSGKYYDKYTHTYTENAVYINVHNPYKINTYFEQISEEYGIEGKINERLASYYLQGDTGNEVFIMLVMFLFFSFIFAIIGVGIIRNTIQLNTIEQIRDYGIMRCIGATKGQLQSIIYRMGFIQEITGIVLGFLIGYPAAAIIGHFAHIKIGVHGIAILYVLIVFLFDLYFVMRENSKAVRKISPMEAVRDIPQKQKKKQKIKKHRKNLFGLLFGVDGDYAYRSLMANKGRFWKSVASFSLGIAAFIGIASVLQSMKVMMDSMYDVCGEYQVYFYEPVSENGIEDEDVDVDTAKSMLPDEDVLRKIAQNPAVSRVKSIYAARLFATDTEDFFAHYNPVFLNETYEGETVQKVQKTKKDVGIRMCSSACVYGYDAEEYASYEGRLVDGTLDVSEHGIVLVQTCKTYKKTENPDDYEMIDTTLYTYKVTDYEVGDTITFTFGGKTETYTIEGIVQEEKDNLYAPGFVKAIVPLESFFAITGLEEGDATGIKYEMKMNDIDTLLSDLLDTAVYDAACISADSLQLIQMLRASKNMFVYVGCFVLFVLVMSSLNIVNTSASNLHLRRLEFVQLRVIGVSVRRLRRMVMMEGVITTIVANVIGDVLGFAVLVPMMRALYYVMDMQLAYPAVAAVVGLIISLTVFCGAVYFPMRKMGQGVLQGVRE